MVQHLKLRYSSKILSQGVIQSRAYINVLGYNLLEILSIFALNRNLAPFSVVFGIEIEVFILS